MYASETQFFSKGKTTKEVEQSKNFLIVGGKPSGRAAEFAFSQELLDDFKIDITNGIGFQYDCDGVNYQVVVTGGYDMREHQPSTKSYIFNSGLIVSEQEFALPVFNAAQSIC